LARVGFWYRFAAIVLRPPIVLLTKRDWRGSEHIPSSEGFVAAVNHVSHVDPIMLAHFLYDHGRPPRYLAKAGLFTVPVIGRVVRGTGQIPVYRETSDASVAFGGAVEAVRRGECVAIYPEGTITRDPGLWPMTGKTGAARVGLTTGCPVVPIAQWGPQALLAPYSKRPHVFPRKTMHMLAGPPVDLSDLADAEITADVLRVATDRIMAAITRLLEEIRGETAPATRYDPRAKGHSRMGRPSAPNEERPA
jgi:1-acyl-sn-glycerol-3-phosphate acyltransferase